MNEIDELAEFMANISPAYAKSFVHAVFEKIELLRNFPQLGRKVPEGEHDDVRELIFKQYRIFYQVGAPSHINILSVQSSSHPPRDIT